MILMVCNIGSTSLKFKLLEMDGEKQLCHGHIENVGSDSATVHFWHLDKKVFEGRAMVATQREAVQQAIRFLTSGSAPVIRDLKRLAGIGFKTIQAGDKNGSVLLTDEVLQAMEEYRELAPAHNPPYLSAIYMFRELLPQTPLVGVFEPGFHVNSPEYAKIYGVPYEWYEKYGVRRYGYHGATHRYVTHETIRYLDLPAGRQRIIACHLGGSSSLCAFKNGTAIDTSMGFTPQTGLIQGTRTGDLDPYVLPYIMEKKGITLQEALAECSGNGGLAGISGISADMRRINEAIAAGNRRAQLARDKFIYDIKRYIGEYLILMEGVDAIAFSGGIGQADAALRGEVLGALSFLGLRLDEDKNRRHGPLISAEDSAIAALVVQTNEEIVVARETKRVIEQSQQ